MARNSSSDLRADVVQRTKVEITYEYVPILGRLLGYWRKQREHRFAQDIEIHVIGEIGEYDRLLINGREVPLPKRQ